MPRHIHTISLNMIPPIIVELEKIPVSVPKILD
jgi:hypothetical protein